ncbi:MAG: MFS transporter [Verrucomicrobiae bacterium]|nr:MFS transporter [Verrucomicrobiae bacterium]
MNTAPGREYTLRRLHYGYVVLVLVVLTVFVSLGLGRFGYATILPAMQEGMKLTNAQTGALQSWNLIGYLSTVLLAGLLATRFGPRVVIAISLLIASAGMILTGLFPTYAGARVGRFVAGVGGAGGNVPAMALVSAWFAPRRRGIATGVAVGGSSVGLMFTGLIIPRLLDAGGSERWRLCWYVLGAIGCCVAVVCALFLRDRAEEMGLKPIGESGQGQGHAQLANRTNAPGLSEVVASKVLWHLAAIYFAFGFSYIIYATFFVRYLVKEVGFSNAMAGNLWFLTGVVSGASGYIWGALSDKWGRRTGLVIVFALQGISFLLLGLCRQMAAVWISAGIFALTSWSIPALMAALAGDVFGADRAPAALGLMTIVFGGGQVLGPWLAGRIADTTYSFTSAFTLAGMVALVWGAGGSFLVSTTEQKR